MINKKIEVLKLNDNRINKLRLEEFGEFDLINEYILKSESEVENFQVDNLSSIATKYGTTWQEIARINELSNFKKLVIKRKFRIDY
ncbi:LysM domain-containing protein [uncultured Clostridium sp.]|uniref:LysM peptidoglycan-binding domain-containing protein n=1 Tax=uncultured Clostridium sp. TaxID=59620 RepID=UPI00341A4C37